jgi:hypothetical protein
MVSYLTAAGYDAGWTEFVPSPLGSLLTILESYPCPSSLVPLLPPFSFDTKQHYIPHTRSRGYVVAFRNESRQPMDPDSDDFREVETSGIGKKHLEKWFKICTALKRAPTSTLEAFCLAEDDPRLVQAKTDRAKHDIKTSKKRSTSALSSLLCLPFPVAPSRADPSRITFFLSSSVDWSKSATRHSTARHDEDLGDHRPYSRSFLYPLLLLHSIDLLLLELQLIPGLSSYSSFLPPFFLVASWREDGSIDYPVGAWVEWAQNQPERVHDLIDISFLRRALLPTEQNPKGKNEDMSYRTIILNVSQNVYVAA